MTLHWSRWWPRIQAAWGGHVWQACPSCWLPFGSQEDSSGTNHYGTLPSDEEEPLVLCPSCVLKGVGCWAHAEEGRGHADCEFAPLDVIWPEQDGDLPADPPTEVFEPVEFQEWKPGGYIPPPRPARHGELLFRIGIESYLDANHTAEDAVRVRQILNPTQPEVEPEPTVDGVTRAARRRTEFLERHTDLLAAVVDDNVRVLLVEHGPQESPEGLVCHGCGPRNTTIGDVAVTYFVEFPCDTWTIADHLQRRDT